MNKLRFSQQTAAFATAAGLTLFLGSAAFSQSVTFTQTPVSNVVSQMAHQYGVNIVLKGNISPARRITFNVSDVSTPGGHLEAVSNFADALGADFKKVFVVSKVSAGTAVPTVKIDSNAPVVFKSTTVPAVEAIRLVASVDDAITQFSGNMAGTVTMSSTTLNASDAAMEIAQQTHTQWKAFYLVAPHGSDPRLAENTYTSFVREPQPAPPAQTASGAQDNTNVNANQQYAANDPNAYGYNPYAAFGYDPYASNPYGVNPYAPPPATDGFGNPVPPGYGGVASVGYPRDWNYGSTTVLPSFPYMGGYGPYTLGGY